jgi:ABC-type glycerol-3-phosphate transport system substrate-binding protein
VLPGLITTEESLRANGLPKDGNLTFDELLPALKTFAEANGATPYTQQNQLLHFLLRCSDLKLIDNENRRANYDALRSEEFRRVMDVYKSYYAYDFIENDYVNNDAEALERQERLLVIEAQPIGYFVDYSMISPDSTPVMGVVSNTDGEVTAQVREYIVIRAGSENKANAWRFLKILLSKPRQVDDISCFYFPVLKSALQARFEPMYSDPSATIYSAIYGDIHRNDFAPLESFDGLFAMAEKVDRAVLHQPQEHDFLWEAMKPYFDGNKSYDYCLNELTNMLELFAGE